MYGVGYQRAPLVHEQISPTLPKSSLQSSGRCGQREEVEGARPQISKRARHRVTTWDRAHLCRSGGITRPLPEASYPLVSCLRRAA
jgi:hypothetical protein